MSFAKKILGAFVEITPDEQPVNSNTGPVKSIFSTPSVTTSLNTSTAATGPYVAPITAADAGEMQKFISHFNELFEKSNLPGPDYFEFEKMKQAMSTLPNEAKFPAAFAALQVQGLNKAKLLASAQQYIQIINDDSKGFEAALGNSIGAEAENKKKQAQALTETAAQKQQMILQLQQEIIQHQADSERLLGEVKQQEDQINVKLNAYRAACTAMINAIQVDTQEINRLIP